MLIALTGLHGAGKSYFANNILAKYGFKIYSKKELLPYICKSVAGRTDWQQWYREEFAKNIEKITTLILSYINLDEDVVIDSVHNSLEWKIISSKVENAELIGIVAPEPIRKQRRKGHDEEKDKRRISYWHNAENGCLMSNLDWVFNGGASLTINEQLFSEFLGYVENKGSIQSGECISYTNNKIDRLNELIKENNSLDERLIQAEQILEDLKGGKQEEEDER